MVFLSYLRILGGLHQSNEIPEERKEDKSRQPFKSSRSMKDKPDWFVGELSKQESRT